MSGKHTPGDWVFHEIDPTLPTGFCVRAGTKHIADVWRVSDAQLISAAPDMLEALKEVEWVFMQNEQAGWEECPCCGGLREQRGHAKDCKLAAAIRKAEGRTDA